MTTIPSPGAALSAMRPNRQIVCQVCGKSFTAKDGRAKFCSNACKQRDKYQKKKAGRKNLETV
jgi:predicted nucleic acid-binding Zn ribbon protein